MLKTIEIHLGLAVMAALLLGTANVAQARPECTRAGRDAWLPESEMKSRIAAAGYQIEIFKVTAEGCYEIYGRNQAGKRVEVYYHPVTGEVVRSSR